MSEKSQSQEEPELLHNVWERTFEEGERRMSRSSPGLASTGFVGGIDVMLGLIAVVALTGAMLPITDADTAHAIGSFAFGIALVLIAIGRSELFTENFLVPVGALLAGHGSRSDLVRMWALTFAFNLVGLTIFAAIAAIDGVVTENAAVATGDLAERWTERNLLSAIGSGVLAGIVMTSFTWVLIALRTDTARVLLGLLIGFLLLLPALNHAVVSFGEVMLAIFLGEGRGVNVWEVTWHEAVAVASNLLGGITFVTATRLAQASGEPGRKSGPV